MMTGSIVAGRIIIAYAYGIFRCLFCNKVTISRKRRKEPVIITVIEFLLIFVFPLNVNA
jgi:hypothetical protein